MQQLDSASRALVRRVCLPQWQQYPHVCNPNLLLPRVQGVGGEVVQVLYAIASSGACAIFLISPARFD